MKITKRQLQRIIKEEKAKLIRESIVDMVQYDNLIQKYAYQLSENFGEDMMQLFEEEPGAFAGRSSLMEWQEQVDSAQAELAEAIVEALRDTIQQVESELHDGQYYRG